MSAPRSARKIHERVKKPSHTFSCRRNPCGLRRINVHYGDQTRVPIQMSRTNTECIDATKFLDAVSRREMQRVIDELKQQFLTPPPPYADLPPRRRAMLGAAARAAVLVDSRAWNKPAVVEQFWDGLGPLPSRKELRGLARMTKAMAPTLRDLNGKMGIWTGGFFQGLRLAGAISDWRGRTRLLCGRPWLEKDFELMSIPGRLGPANDRGRWLCRCLAARVSAKSEFGADVVAGLFAGARRQDGEDGTWLVVPNSDAVLRLVDWWKISANEVRLPSRRGLVKLGLRVSPFYGLLFGGLMPEATANAMIVRHPGDCPMLPLAYWQVLYGAGGADEFYCNPPHAGLLPYLVSHSTRKRLRLGREDLYHASVQLGVSFVPLELRRFLEGWRHAALARLNGDASMRNSQPTRDP